MVARVTHLAQGLGRQVGTQCTCVVVPKPRLGRFTSLWNSLLHPLTRLFPEGGGSAFYLYGSGTLLPRLVSLFPGGGLVLDLLPTKKT